MTIGFKTVWLPSYCCDTMVELFIRNGIGVCFYSVIVDSEKGLLCSLPEPEKEEALYMIPYYALKRI